VHLERLASLSDQETVFAQLMATIETRRAQPSEKSYTSQLLSGGAAKIRKKIVEEAAEVFEAAGNSDPAGRDKLINESADLLYHLFVLLACREIGLGEVEAELARRFGVSGLAEKASRQKNADA
jgi:phosphoribosyl-ATP pyrophosphohydrolase